jgi:hypothetical protein
LPPGCVAVRIAKCRQWTHAFTKRTAFIFRAKLAIGTIAIIATFKVTDTFTSSAVAFLITGTGFV